MWSSPGTHRLALHWQELAFASVYEMEWRVSYRGTGAGQSEDCILSKGYTLYILIHQKGPQHWLPRLRRQAKLNVTVCNPPSIQIHNKHPSAESVEHPERKVRAIWTKTVTPVLPIIRSNFKISNWLTDLFQCMWAHLSLQRINLKYVIVSPKLVCKDINL